MSIRIYIQRITDRLQAWVSRGKPQHLQEAAMVQPNSAVGNTHQGCVHHWLCGDQQNGVVHGVCTKCAMEMDFVQAKYFEKLAWKRGEGQSGSDVVENG